MRISFLTSIVSIVCFFCHMRWTGYWLSQKKMRMLRLLIICRCHLVASDSSIIVNMKDYMRGSPSKTCTMIDRYKSSSIIFIITEMLNTNIFVSKIKTKYEYIRLKNKTEYEYEYIRLKNKNRIQIWMYSVSKIKTEYEYIGFKNKNRIRIYSTQK